MNPYLRAVLFLLALLLLGVALLTGGCSVIFTPMVLEPGGSFDPLVGAIWFAGLALGGLCLWGAIAIFRRLSRPDLPQATTFAGGEDPDAPASQAKDEAPGGTRRP